MQQITTEGKQTINVCLLPLQNIFANLKTYSQ